MIRINIDSTMDEIPLKSNNIKTIINKNIKSKGNDKLNELYKWDMDDFTLIAYGWCDGNAGYENKHELIPNGLSSILTEDSSEALLFGDIFIFKKYSGKLLPLTIAEYGEIYLNLCEGFDNCESSDGEVHSTEEEDDDTDDEDFDIQEISSDDDSLEYIEELDYDENNYSDLSDEEDKSSDLSDEDLSEDLSDEDLSDEDLSDEDLSDEDLSDD